MLNLAGEVIGVNTATAPEAQSIGFALPSNRVRRDLYQVRELGKIAYPFLGIEYRIVTEKIQAEENLQVDYGALVEDVVLRSPAVKAGIKKGDILLEFDGKKITSQDSLGKIIQQYDETSAKPVYNPGDTVTVKVLRGSQELILNAVLDERKDNI